MQCASVFHIYLPFNIENSAWSVLVLLMLAYVNSDFCITPPLVKVYVARAPTTRRGAPVLRNRKGGGGGGAAAVINEGEKQEDK